MILEICCRSIPVSSLLGCAANNSPSSFICWIIDKMRLWGGDGMALEVWKHIPWTAEQYQRTHLVAQPSRSSFIAHSSTFATPGTGEFASELINLNITSPLVLLGHWALFLGSRKQIGNDMEANSLETLTAVCFVWSIISREMEKCKLRLRRLRKVTCRLIHLDPVDTLAQTL